MAFTITRPPDSPTGLLNTIILIFLPLLPVLLGFWIGLARPRDPLAWLVLALTLSYAAFFYPGAETWQPWLRGFGGAFRAGGQSSLFLWLLLFAIYFPESFPASSRWKVAERWKWVLLVPVAMFATSNAILGIWNIEDWQAPRFLRHLPPIVPQLGIAAGFAAIALALILLTAKYRTAISLDSRRRLRLLFASAIVGLGPLYAVQLFQMLAHFNFELHYPGGSFIIYVAFFLFPLALAYVILVQRAMDVRVAVQQGLQYALAKNGVTVIQLALTLAIFWAAVALAAGGSNHPREIAVIVLSLIAIAGIRSGSDRLRRWIDRKFFREAYNAEVVLSELSDQVRSIVEPRSLLQTVVERICETLHIQQVAVLLETGSPFRPAYAHGYGSVPELHFSAQSAAVKELQREKEPVRVYLDDPDSWIYRDPESSEQERRELAELGTEVLLPLPGREKLLGFISLGRKRSEEPFTGNDLRLLKSVATQTGLALENARLLAAITEEVAQRERLNREVEIAREVQERLFPQELPAIAGLDYRGACRPAQGVGGDYYDFLKLADGGLGIAIGDVSGKGISAALLMASLEASLRAEAGRSSGHLPNLVENVNRLVYQASTSNRYATFFYGQYLPARREFVYVNAGHNPPLRLRPGDSEIMRLETGGTVIGLLESSTWQQETIALERGDLLVAFTDGISEAMNADGEEWGEERLVETIRTCKDLKASEILSRIMQAADAFAAGAQQHDDMTIIVMKIES